MNHQYVMDGLDIQKAIEEALQALSFAEEFCIAVRRFAYMLALIRGETDQAVALGGWLNGGIMPADVQSRAPGVALVKVGTVVATGSRDLIVTPVDDPDLAKFGIPWMGGAGLGEFALAVSKWRQQHDLLPAALATVPHGYRTTAVTPCGYSLQS